jgi:hypothetical protein
MNFLAHALQHLDSSYAIAGTAVPDWLSVLDRRVRTRSKHAMELLDDEDEDIRSLARGIVQHHHDDQWFHSSRLFNETALRFAVELRDRLPGDEGFRPSFVGHIVTEMLIDATLLSRNPSLGRIYYAAIESVSAEKIRANVAKIAAMGKSFAVIQDAELSELPLVIKRFAQARFLYDYADDDKLLFRLNQVMKRVRLPLLPYELTSWLAETRRVVEQRCDALLTPGP